MPLKGVFALMSAFAQWLQGKVNWLCANYMYGGCWGKNLSFCQWRSTMVHQSGEPKLWNKCWSGQVYVERGVLPGCPRLLVFDCTCGFKCGLRSFGFLAQRIRRMLLTVEMPVSVVARAPAATGCRCGQWP